MSIDLKSQGLYITKALVERHRGWIDAWSDGLGCGTTFQVELPTFHVDEPERFFPSSEMEATLPQQLHSTPTGAENSNKQENKAPGLNILIVEDVSSNRKLLRRILERAGHVCTEAENGKIAVDLIRDGPARPFDTILMGKQKRVVVCFFHPVPCPASDVFVLLFGCPTFRL